MRPTIPPDKNAVDKQIIIAGNPKNNPKRKENLTSPNPMPFPFEKK